VIAALTNARVRVITFAPHTTHIFQMLDVVLFGAMKKRTSRLEMWNEEADTAAFIIRLYHDFKQTMVKVNVWGAFSAIGFSYDIRESPYRSLFDEEKFRQSGGSWNSGRMTRLWRVCRHGVDMPNLNGLTNQNQCIWSKNLAILPTRSKDMEPTT
jgi:hypothetical protein